MSHLIKKVIQDNRLVNANYKLTLSETRLFYLAMAQIHSDDTELKKYSISAADLKSILGVEHNLYRTLKTAMDNITKRNITIESTEKKELISFPLIKYVRYSEEEGILDIEFSESFAPYVLQMRKYFTQVSLEKIAPLKSSYSVRIYTLLQQYKIIGYRRFEISELKKTLGITTQFKMYADFKKRVLKPAQKELLEYTDIGFTFDEIKEKRKIVAISIEIIKGKNKDYEGLPEPLPMFPEDEMYTISEDLKALNFSENEIKRLINEEKLNTLEVAIKITKEKIENNAIHTSAKALCRKLIENNLATTAYEEEIKTPNSKKKEEDLKRIKKNREKGTELYKKYQEINKIQKLNSSFEEWVSNTYNLRVKPFKAFCTLWATTMEHEGYEIY